MKITKVTYALLDLLEQGAELQLECANGLDAERAKATVYKYKRTYGGDYSVATRVNDNLSMTLTVHCVSKAGRNEVSATVPATVPAEVAAGMASKEINVREERI